MWMRIVAFLSLFFSFVSYGETKPPLVFIVSGGLGTCSSNLHLQMQQHLMGFAARAHQAGYPVKFILTCFDGLREDMQYSSIDNYSGQPSATHVIPGGKNFEADFASKFLNGYLKREIPPNARVITAGQSHGGWVSLAVAASRPVDFLTAFDPISRTECNLKNVFNWRLVRNLKNNCTRAASPSLIAAVEKNLALSGGFAMSLFQTASILHSSPIGSPWIRDFNFGQFKPEYAGIAGKRALNLKAHMGLAVDDAAWAGVLAQLDRKMAELDPNWQSLTTPPATTAYRPQTATSSTHLF